MKILNLVLALSLMACGAEDDTRPVEPTYSAFQAIALQGDNASALPAEAELGSKEFENCAMKVKTADLGNLSEIEGRAFKKVVVNGNPCEYYMSVEGLVTRSVKICATEAVITLTCH